MITATDRIAGAEWVFFWCQGCQRRHGARVGVQSSTDPRETWDWNGSLDKPTFTPSILVTYSGADAGRDGAPPARCHSWVADGRIEYLGDSTHAMAGQTVDLPEMPDWKDRRPPRGEIHRGGNA